MSEILKSMHDKASTAVTNAEVLEVNDHSSFTMAAGYLKEANIAIKEVEEYYDPKVKAAHAAHKTLTSERAGILKPLEESKKKMAEKLIGYHDGLEQLQKSGSTNMLTNPTDHGIDGLSFRETWSFEINDLSEVPSEYLKADETKIRKVVQALGSEANIPGITLIRKKSVVAK